MGRVTWCDALWFARVPCNIVWPWHQCALPHPHDTVHVCECGDTLNPAPPA
jgi:hypothetical protein